MPFLHCHSCNWSQDDFWEKDGYNPFQQYFIDEIKNYLFEKDLITMDINVLKELNLPYILENGECKVEPKDLVLSELKRKIKQIENMQYHTYEDWKESCETAVCPKCGEKNWDID